MTRGVFYLPIAYPVSLFEEELNNYIQNLSTPLSSNQKNRLNNFIKILKTGMNISALSEAFDAIYILGGETEESSLKNLVKNAHHCTAVGSPTWTQFKGFQGGTNKYLDTNYNPRTAGVSYLTNSASYGIYSFTDVAGSYADMGTRDGTYVNRTAILPRYSSVYTQYDINSNESNTNLNSILPDSLGLITVVREDSATAKLYKNATLAHTASKTASNVPDSNFYILCRNGEAGAATFSPRQLGFAFIGKGLTASEVTLLFNAFDAYLFDSGESTLKSVLFNPYETIDFSTINKYKGNLHCHTNESDGTNTPQQMVEKYAAYDYDILAISDHDFGSQSPVFPWSNYITETPSAADSLVEEYSINGKTMLAVIGNELSNTHHICSILNDTWQTADDYATNKANMEAMFGLISSKNGYAFLNHPINPYHTGYPTSYDFDDYSTWFSKYDSLLGLEVINSIRTEYVLGPTAGAEPIVEKIWDRLLDHFRYPSRKIWGFSNDDSHNRDIHSFFGYMVFLMPSLTKANFISAIQNGHWYFCLETAGQTSTNHTPTLATPIINDIIVSSSSITIDASNVLEVEGVKQIEWISGWDSVNDTPIVVHTGNVLPLNTTGLKHYVRAKIKGNNGRLTYTQPFGLANVVFDS